MSLKQLRRAKELERKRNGLDEILKREEELDAKKSELEDAIEELDVDSESYDEDAQLIDDDITKYDEAKEENNNEKQELEAEIRALEEELEELESKKPVHNADGESEKRSMAPQNNMIIRGGSSMKVRKGIFKGEERSSVDLFVKRDDMQDFLTNVRSIGQKREISGAELNIPEVALGLLRDELHRYSKLYSKVNARSIKGDGRVTVLGVTPEAIWTEMSGVINELNFEFAQVEVSGYKVAGYIPVDNYLLEDSDINLASEILDMIAQAIGYSLDKAILYGTGVKMPQGIVGGTKAANIGQIAGTKAEDKITNIVRFAGKAKANYGAGNLFFAMNEATFTELQALLVNFDSSGAIVSKVTGQLPVVGGELVILPFIPDGDIIGGYGSQYLLVDRASTKLAVSEHTRFIEDQTVFRGTARYDGRPVFDNAFVVFNLNNSAPAKSIAFAPDVANEEVEEPAGE